LAAMQATFPVSLQAIMPDHLHIFGQPVDPFQDILSDVLGKLVQSLLCQVRKYDLISYILDLKAQPLDHIFQAMDFAFCNLFSGLI
jgi:hypothetical protein